MFKKLWFQWFGERLNMGHVVTIPPGHAISYVGGNNRWHAEEDKGEAYKQLYKSFIGTPAHAWLKENGNYIARVRFAQDWGTQNLMDWYQHPVIRAELSTIRFMDAGDAVTFKLKFL